MSFHLNVTTEAVLSPTRHAVKATYSAQRFSTYKAGKRTALLARLAQFVRSQNGH